jgi:Zn finger protein HypA/HybF involved in hydrogenase expression
MKRDTVKCADCGELVYIGKNSGAAKDNGNWKFYCEKCWRKQVKIELDRIYGDKN